MTCANISYWQISALRLNPFQPVQIHDRFTFLSSRSLCFNDSQTVRPFQCRCDAAQAWLTPFWRLSICGGNTGEPEQGSEMEQSWQADGSAPPCQDCAHFPPPLLLTPSWLIPSVDWPWGESVWPTWADWGTPLQCPFCSYSKVRRSLMHTLSKGETTHAHPRSYCSKGKWRVSFFLLLLCQTLLVFRGQLPWLR